MVEPKVDWRGGATVDRRGNCLVDWRVGSRVELDMPTAEQKALSKVDWRVVQKGISMAELSAGLWA